jgi:beta-galactosidase
LSCCEQAFDCWEWGKNPDDYHIYFDAQWQSDLASMVLRDRNHPSILLYSIGNEIPMRQDPKGVALAQQLRERVHQLDPGSGRVVTSAVPMVSDNDQPFLEELDVCGYNYSPQRYAQDHKQYPERVMMATESFPVQTFTYWDAAWNNPYVLGEFIWTGESSASWW